jgi:hypothetical protein
VAGGLISCSQSLLSHLTETRPFAYQLLAFAIDLALAIDCLDALSPLFLQVSGVKSNLILELRLPGKRGGSGLREWTSCNIPEVRWRTPNLGTMLLER